MGSFQRSGWEQIAQLGQRGDRFVRLGIVGPQMVGAIDPHRLHAATARRPPDERGIVAHIQHLLGRHPGALGRAADTRGRQRARVSADGPTTWAGTSTGTGGTANGAAATQAPGVGRAARANQYMAMVTATASRMLRR